MMIHRQRLIVENAAWAALTIFVVLVTGLIFLYWPRSNHLKNVISIEDHRLDRIEAFSCFWIESNKMASVQFEHDIGRVVIYAINNERNKLSQIPASDSSLANIYLEGISSASRNGKPALLKGDPNAYVYLISSNGLVVDDAAFGRLRGRVFWAPTDDRLLNVSGESGVLCSWKEGQQIQIDSIFRPVIAIGFNASNLFLSATNDILNGEYPRQISLEYWQLDQHPILKKTKEIRIKNEPIVTAIMSPQGKEICWLCSHRMRHPVFNDVFPYLSIEENNFIDVYISSTDAEKFIFVTTIVWDNNFPQVHWTSDGSQISFIRNNKLYLLPILD